MKMKKILIGMITVAVSLSALADYTKISGVMVQQRWPWSRLVDIDYMLVCAPGDSVDVVVEAYNGSERLDLPAASFSGDLYSVQSGARRIVWDPTGTPYGNDGVVPEFRVVLTPTPPPLYMIVDLTKSVGETGQIEYVYEADLTNGSRGAWVRDPVTNRGTVVESVIWTGVAANDIYKTDKLVLRRIPKGDFKLGESVPPTIPTTLTKDFYVGVFQVTAAQWGKVTGEGSISTKPKDWGASYDAIRGTTNSVPTIHWPGTGTLVDPSSFVGRLRAKTGLTDFDLPTEAQWEYACRAGTTTYYNDGIDDSSTNQLNELGWWGGNSEGTTHPVGEKMPNAWGLYDMHGNVMEWCLNYWSVSFTGGTDPKGAESGSHRVVRDGGWNQPANTCRVGRRWRYESSTSSSLTGFRLVMTLP